MAEYRQWREQNRAQLHDVVPLDTPYNVEIEVSSLCNARCIYCAHSTDHGLYEGNMTEELFYKILCDLKAFPHKVKKCNLFGFGESLMHPKFPEMVKETKAADVAEAVEFTTNGMLLTTEKIDAILDAGIDTIRISLQGINEETYQKICGVHLDFHRFINNLTYLFQNRGGVPRPDENRRHGDQGHSRRRGALQKALRPDRRFYLHRAYSADLCRR